MKVFHSFPSQHSDFIHDIAFDFYGKRLASCSSDRKIKIWEVSDKGKWHLQSEWVAHQGSIWKLDWAHPEFGQVIASCSFDRTISIWEEHTIDSTVSNGDPWKNLAQLVDSRETVHDVKFAPRHLGLRLATASADGYVRMYEAIDVMNLTHWPLQEEFLADKDGATCISWNHSRFDVPMIVVGGNSNIAKIWGYNSTYHRWQVLAELGGHKDTILDVAWAPNMGRSYHLIATASKDHTLSIWKLTLMDGGHMQFNVENIACRGHHQSEVWRVEWNVTGTMLSSSGEDGTIRLWKNDYNGNWICVKSICGNMGNMETDEKK